MLQQNRFVTSELLDTLDELRVWLRKLPQGPHNPSYGIGWSAGALIRAAKKQFPALESWRIVDDSSHSWLKKEDIDPSHMYLVLDILPPDVYGGPIIVFESMAHWVHSIYRNPFRAGDYQVEKYEAEANEILGLSIFA
jgi:hypothetical protein